MNNQTSCRSCGASDLRLVLAMGTLPLVNALLSQEQLDQREPRYPLDLAFCPHCALVQITETVPPEVLFREYVYFSTFSDTMLHHAEELVGRLIAERNLDSTSRVIEIASNDGYLLQYYRQHGIPVLGIEPARNVARVAEQERGIPTLPEFFSANLAHDLRARDSLADVIHAHNVLAHVAELNGVVEGIGLLLKDDGVAVIEVPYIKDLIDDCEFDTIYHEHLCYYSLTTLDRLFARHGLVIQDVAHIPLHGGSLQLFVKKAGVSERGSSVLTLLETEQAWGVDRFDFYSDFGSRVENLKVDLRNFLFKIKGEGKRLAAYGAAGKGTMLLNYFDVGRDLLDFVVDRSTYKQGKYMPGVHVPILAPTELLRQMPDYVLLLVWNLADEVLTQQAEYRRHGGKFIIPIPDLQVAG